MICDYVAHFIDTPTGVNESSVHEITGNNLRIREAGMIVLMIKLCIINAYILMMRLHRD